MSVPSQSESVFETQVVVKPKDLKKAVQAIKKAKDILKDKELLFAVSASPVGIEVRISSIMEGEPVAGCAYTALMTILEELKKAGFAPYWIEGEGSTLVIKAIAPQE